MSMNEAHATNQHILSMGGYIRAKALAPLLGISVVTLWRWSASGKIPKPVKLSERVTAWWMEDVRNWMNTRNNGEAK
ncbi:hypothetical protein WP8S18E11_39450 [Aeromonas veronii]|nr:hypothetical protein WP8S18E11_39450 [Aeromonas veronii]